MNDEETNAATSRELNRLLGWTLLIAAGMAAVSAYTWLRLPADVSIPVHFGIDGRPDRFGGKAEGLLTAPIVAFFVAALFRVIPMIEPRRLNLLRSFRAYRGVAIAVMVFLAALHCINLGRQLGWIETDAIHWLGFMLGALLMALGNYFGKVRSNFLFGIRTPWTLSSNLSWDRTHRLGGKLFVLVGLVGMVLTVVAPGFALPVLGGLLISSTLALVAYSWYVWRDAPDRRST